MWSQNRERIVSRGRSGRQLGLGIRSCGDVLEFGPPYRRLIVRSGGSRRNRRRFDRVTALTRPWEPAADFPDHPEGRPGFGPQGAGSGVATGVAFEQNVLPFRFLKRTPRR
jgi:hypothetical protein